jgi:hypothetical protein
MTAVVADTHTIIWYLRDTTRYRIKETGFFPSSSLLRRYLAKNPVSRHRPIMLK